MKQQSIPFIQGFMENFTNLLIVKKYKNFHFARQTEPKRTAQDETTNTTLATQQRKMTPIDSIDNN